MALDKFKSKLCCLMKPLSKCSQCDELICRACIEVLGNTKGFYIIYKARADLGTIEEACFDSLETGYPVTDTRGFHFWVPGSY